MDTGEGIVRLSLCGGLRSGNEDAGGSWSIRRRLLDRRRTHLDADRVVQVLIRSVLFRGNRSAGEQERKAESGGSPSLNRIIGHISFDIHHLPFEDLWLPKQMTNDKCQMVYDQ